MPTKKVQKRRERCANYTADERKLLIRIAKNYKSVLESNQTNSVAIQKKNRVWALIHRQYNASAEVRPRTCLQLKRLYENMKRKHNYPFFSQHFYSPTGENGSCSLNYSSGDNEEYTHDIESAYKSVENITIADSDPKNAQDEFSDTKTNENYFEDSAEQRYANIYKLQCELLIIKKENAALKQMYLKKKNQLLDQKLIAHDVKF